MKYLGVKGHDIHNLPSNGSGKKSMYRARKREEFKQDDEGS